MIGVDLMLAVSIVPQALVFFVLMPVHLIHCLSLSSVLPLLFDCSPCMSNIMCIIMLDTHSSYCRQFVVSLMSQADTVA